MSLSASQLCSERSAYRDYSARLFFFYYFFFFFFSLSLSFEFLPLCRHYRRLPLSSGGAYEISQRMTAMIGWGGTTGFAEDWVYNGAVETYVEDPDMAALLRRNNPQAFSNIVGRFLEAARRGMWKADPERIEMLEKLYFEMDSELEGRS